MHFERVFDNPDLFLFAFDDGDAVFVEMDRTAYHRSIFLDRRISPKGASAQRARLADLYTIQERVKPPVGANGYIFHVAHCGSTLLARALDLPDANLVCREPMALRQLGVQASSAAGGAPGEEWDRRVRLLSAMLGRRYAPGGPVIVKANVPVNFMLAPLMQLGPAQPAILLHFSLENYLPAVLRGDVQRNWVEHITNELRPGLEAVAGPRAEAPTPALDAARLWLAQTLLFLDTLRGFENAVSLDAEVLFNEPAPVLQAAFAHFGQPQERTTADNIVASDLFARYSKDPRYTFDNTQRRERQLRLRQELASDIAAARAWLLALPAAAALPARLPKPLTGEAGLLIEGA